MHLLKNLKKTSRKNKKKYKKINAIQRGVKEAEAEGRGAIRLGGRLIDEAHVHTARQQLARAARLGLMGDREE